MHRYSRPTNWTARCSGPSISAANIREGAHYTQFLVYDFDGDGRAEFVCKTADGTTDGTGTVLGDAKANWLTPESAGEKPGAVTAPRREGTSASGFILSGPEYLTVFDGLTGKALASETYLPRRHPDTDSPTPEQMKEIWGDGHGNRIDRFLAGVAYLDGEHPSIVMARGYYTRAVLAAWDFRRDKRGAKLSSRWVFDSDSSEKNQAYRGQGNHSLSVADVDGDGRDEIIYGAAVIDDDGKGLYSTGWGHGDALHVSDLDPANPGLEIFDIQERFGPEGMSLRDARTGKPLFTIPSVKADESGGDKGEGPGRGVAFNIDPRFPGAETWAAGAGMSGLYDVHGRKFVEGRPAGLSTNFAIWWDGDLLRELLDQNVISKWNWETQIARTAARRTPMHVQQRHEGDAGALGRSLGRLARRSDLAHARQPRAAHLHHDDSDAASHGHADARSAVPAGDRLAERRVQPAAAPQLLSRRSGAVAEEAGDPLYARLELRADRIFGQVRGRREWRDRPSTTLERNGKPSIARSPATASLAFASAPAMLVCTVSSMNWPFTASGAFALESVRDQAREIDERHFLVRRRLPGPQPVAVARRTGCAPPSSYWSW